MSLFLPQWTRLPTLRRSPAALLALLGVALLMSPPPPSARAGGNLFDIRGQAQAQTKGKELVQAAFAASEAGDSARALGLLDQAERLRPDQPDALNLRGAILLRQGDFARAESAFTRAAALDPDLWAARFNVAEVAFRRKDYVRARTLFDRLVAQTDRYKATTQWELAQYKAVLACLLAGDEAGSQRRLTKLTPATAAPSPVLLYAQAAAAFARKDHAGATRLLASAQALGKPGANAIYLRSLEAAGWVAPIAAPLSLPPGVAPGISVASVGGSGGGSNRRSQVIIANLPITEPELPGASSSGSVAPSALTGGGTTRAVASKPPLNLPPLVIIPEPTTAADPAKPPSPSGIERLLPPPALSSPTPALPGPSPEKAATPEPSA